MSPSAGEPDLYAVLGVAGDATEAQILRAFRHRALIDHPDRGGDAEAFRGLYRARETLLDPARRAAYDRRRAPRPAPGATRTAGAQTPGATKTPNGNGPGGNGPGRKDPGPTRPPGPAASGTTEADPDPDPGNGPGNGPEPPPADPFAWESGAGPAAGPGAGPGPASDPGRADDDSWTYTDVGPGAEFSWRRADRFGWWEPGAEPPPPKRRRRRGRA
ncbi:DnaJ domain-containing protein [Streptomyces sp. NPDC000594]|uniref:DnaJ domain-containing protein n=1 Tax=Streptomyces sp. NPDC000594 TaxID=3154261 RepID=UPI0033165EB8